MKGINTMKDTEKKVNATEEVKTEEKGVKLTDEQLIKVTGGKGQNDQDEISPGAFAGYCPTCENAGLNVSLTGDYNRTQGLMTNIRCPYGHTFPDLPW